jgi:hypothetical protein
MKPSPANNSDLWLKRTLRTAITRAAIMDKVDEIVCICPITPTGCPNVDAISIRRSPDVMFGGEVANLAIANDGRRSLFLTFFSGMDLVSSIYFPFDLKNLIFPSISCVLELETE